MPNIDQITPVEYDSGWPYDADYDNLPLRGIVARLDLVNSAVDQQQQILEDAKGSAGTVSNRLNQSMDEDGSLLDDAVDETLHNIGAHTDGEYDGTDYVRMYLTERQKLALMADEATALKIQFDTVSTISSASTTALFANETIEILNSDTIQWFFTAPNKISANMTFDPALAHQHYYNLTPVHYNLSTPDYTNYKVNSLATAFTENSLKVYVNGIRLNETSDVYVYTASSGPSGSWTATSYTSYPDDGLFTINRALDASDVIKIDFDINLV